MTPKVYRIASRDDIARLVPELAVRLRIAGPCEAYVTQAGEGTEFAAWQRRYRKLVALLSEQVVVDGVRYSDRVWDLTMKGRFTLPQEATLADGKKYTWLKSTKDMTREERDEFLRRVREFAAEHGIALQHPDEEGQT